MEVETNIMDHLPQSMSVIMPYCLSCVWWPFWSHWVQFSSVAQSCLTLCDPKPWSMPGLPVHHQLLEFTQLMFTESVMPSNHLILCHPLLLPPSIFCSIRVFSNWPKYRSFSFNISPSKEYSGLISFMMDWLNLLAIQGTLKSLLQHHSSKVLSFLYGPTLTSIHDYWKTIAWLDRPLLAK